MGYNERKEARRKLWQSNPIRGGEVYHNAPCPPLSANCAENTTSGFNLGRTMFTPTMMFPAIVLNNGSELSIQAHPGSYASRDMSKPAETVEIETKVEIVEFNKFNGQHTDGHFHYNWVPIDLVSEYVAKVGINFRATFDLHRARFV